MLEEFGPSLYLMDGPTVPFFGFPYPTRMAVARLSDGSVWTLLIFQMTLLVGLALAFYAASEQ